MTGSTGIPSIGNISIEPRPCSIGRESNSERNGLSAIEASFDVCFLSHEIKADSLAAFGALLGLSLLAKQLVPTIPMMQKIAALDKELTVPPKMRGGTPHEQTAKENGSTMLF
jgi:hypothetical protein